MLTVCRWGERRLTSRRYPKSQVVLLSSHVHVLFAIVRVPGSPLLLLGETGKMAIF